MNRHFISIEICAIMELKFNKTQMEEKLYDSWQQSFNSPFLTSAYRPTEGNYSHASRVKAAPEDEKSISKGKTSFTAKNKTPPRNERGRYCEKREKPTQFFPYELFKGHMEKSELLECTIIYAAEDEATCAEEKDYKLSDAIEDIQYDEKNDSPSKSSLHAAGEIHSKSQASKQYLSKRSRGQLMKKLMPCTEISISLSPSQKIYTEKLNQLAAKAKSCKVASPSSDEKENKCNNRVFESHFKKQVPNGDKSQIKDENKTRFINNVAPLKESSNKRSFSTNKQIGTKSPLEFPKSGRTMAMTEKRCQSFSQKRKECISSSSIQQLNKVNIEKRVFTQPSELATKKSAPEQRMRNITKSKITIDQKPVLKAFINSKAFGDYCSKDQKAIKNSNVLADFYNSKIYKLENFSTNLLREKSVKKDSSLENRIESLVTCNSRLNSTKKAMMDKNSNSNKAVKPRGAPTIYGSPTFSGSPPHPTEKEDALNLIGNIYKQTTLKPSPGGDKNYTFVREGKSFHVKPRLEDFSSYLESQLIYE